MAGQRLGQHFLRSQGILERIAAAVCQPGEPLVIEIGPGRGALTRHLIPRAKRLVAIEMDAALAEELRVEAPGVEVIHADVLAADLSAYGTAVIAGNLPYYITSPIIDKVLTLGPLLHRAVFLIQKEVAQRLAARPGSRDYGYLTVTTQARCRVEKLFTVKPAAFSPPPKVDSAVVRLTPRETPFTEDLPGFLRFASLCFRQKRKTLRNNLAAFVPGPLLTAQAEAGLRAEQLSLEEMLGLYQRLKRGIAPLSDYSDRGFTEI